MNQQKEAECCPRLDPTLWEGKLLKWKNKKFIKDKVFTFFYMPVNFGSVITHMVKKIEKVGTVMKDGLCLSNHTSMWNMDLYLAVDREIPGAKNVTLSGKFLTKVYEGNFKDTGVWCKDFEGYAKSKKMNVKKMYMWYTTCPACAKKYGKNYVVIVAQV